MATHLYPISTSLKWKTLLISVLLISSLIMLHIRLYKYAFDDAYIHFRVARNLYETGMPFFNIHDPIKVSTSSGWVVFLTTVWGIIKLFKLSISLPLIIAILNALLTVAAAQIYTAIIKEILRERFSVLYATILQTIFFAVMLPSSIGLMETPLALLIAGIGIYYLLLSKPIGFTMLSLACYIRLEFLILFMLASLFGYIKQQFKLYQILGYAIVGFLPLVCFDLYFFRTIIPHSIVAKSTVYSIAPSTTFLGIIFFSLPPTPFSTFKDLSGVTFLLLLIIISWVILRKKNTKIYQWPYMFSLLGLGIAGLYVFGHAYIFDWYIPLYSVPILLACVLYSTLVIQPFQIILKSLLVITSFIALVSIFTTLLSALSNPSYFSLFESGSRVRTYLMVGNILNEDYPNKALLSSEIGGLGYSFPGEMLDAGGLASLNVLAFHPMKIPEERANGLIGAIPPSYVKLTMPDLIVSYDNFAQALLKDDIVNKYNIITIPAYLPEDEPFSKTKLLWGNKYLRVYILKSLPISSKLCAISVLPEDGFINPCK